MYVMNRFIQTNYMYNSFDYRDLAVNVEPITDWKEINIIPIYMGLNREIKPGIGNITDEELQEARRLIRKFPQCPLIKSDVKRPEMLREFVAL
ncbi:MAG: hypothetical protein C5S46_02825, partial [Candidatus Methanomarinus sp.]